MDIGVDAEGHVSLPSIGSSTVLWQANKGLWKNRTVALTCNWCPFRFFNPTLSTPTMVFIHFNPALHLPADKEYRFDNIALFSPNPSVKNCLIIFLRLIYGCAEAVHRAYAVAHVSGLRRSEDFYLCAGVSARSSISL